MKNILFLVALLGSTLLMAQSYDTARVIDSILVSNTKDETFALYLPASYDSTKLSSVVFIFEPMARGSIGIAPFIKASEKFGHILICSNNTKNGPYDQNFDITDRIFNHVFSHFNISENQIYLAGFSGGSRLASAIATLTNKIEGVVACGAGFSSLSSHIPSNQNYSYVGVVGDRDMNYAEMVSVRGYLEEKKLTNTLITFEGSHRWPPSETILSAFDWLAVHAHKKGQLVLGENKIKKSYQKNYLAAKKMENDGNLLSANENYERILSTFSSFYTLDSVVNDVAQLHKKKAYKNAIKALESAFKKEAELSKNFNNQFNKDFLMPTKIDYGWWKKELGKLNKINAAPSIEMHKMVERVKFKIYANAYSNNNPIATKEQKEFLSSLFKLIYPDSGMN
ncbi:MAG: hypothetical protein COA50_16175 [Flavobacteriaceae bacterium]|nr:MAG: hypothetical protein COA50_16175 [Flavobacteriaceae bacterium]